MDKPILSVDRAESEYRIRIRQVHASRGIEPTPEKYRCTHLAECRSAADRRKVRFATGCWAYVGADYGEARVAGKAAKILFVAMDRGGNEIAMNETFPETQREFRMGAELRWNPHMGGVSTIMEHMVDETNLERYARQFALTNALKCVDVTGRAKTNPTNVMIRNCTGHLAVELSVLEPDIVITQGAHPHSTVVRLLDAASVQQFGNPTRARGHVHLYRAGATMLLATPHPARLKGLGWKRGTLPNWFEEGVAALCGEYVATAC